MKTNTNPEFLAHADQMHALRQLIRSYALQIEYLRLLIDRQVLEPEGARLEMALVNKKMSRAVERLCQHQWALRFDQEPPGWAIDPALIPDLQSI
ncbi:MAG: hypothetical protein ACK2UK_03575 [Candidatus Promineifilaceae bacterium]